MRKVLFALFVLISSITSAQPVINYANSGLPMVSNFGINLIQLPGYPNTSANHVWDFSLVSAGIEDSIEYLRPQDAPVGGIYNNFSDACLRRGSKYKFFIDDVSYIRCLTGVFDGTDTTIYYDGDIHFFYPLQFGDTLDDAWQYLATPPSDSIFRNGRTISKADGYGTLKLPNGNFSTVLRLHLHKVYYDGLGLDTVDIIEWLLPGLHTPLLEYRREVFGGIVTESSFFVNTTPTSINEISKLVDFVKIYPNPSKDVLYVESINKSDGILELCSLEGKVLLRKEINEFSKTRLDISFLPKGNYLLHFSKDDVRIAGEMIFKN